jgi:hypothetical protein
VRNLDVSETLATTIDRARVAARSVDSVAPSTVPTVDLTSSLIDDIAQQDELLRSSRVGLKDATIRSSSELRSIIAAPSTGQMVSSDDRLGAAFDI